MGSGKKEIFIFIFSIRKKQSIGKNSLLEKLSRTHKIPYSKIPQYKFCVHQKMECTTCNLKRPLNRSFSWISAGMTLPHHEGLV